MARIHGVIVNYNTAELLRRGFGEAELRKIYRENFARVFRAVVDDNLAS